MQNYKTFTTQKMLLMNFELYFNNDKNNNMTNKTKLFVIIQQCRNEIRHYNKVMTLIVNW